MKRREWWVDTCYLWENPSEERKAKLIHVREVLPGDYSYEQLIHLEQRLEAIEAAAREVVESAKASSDGRTGRVPDNEIDKLERLLNEN